MREVSSLLKRNSIKANCYQKKGNSIIVRDDEKKYVVKKNDINKKIFNYLDSRNFHYYPNIYDYNENYLLEEYVDEIDIPKEQKLNDLINLVSHLHSQTAFYKEVDEADYKTLYEDLSNNALYLSEYYIDLITLIDSKIYLSPSEYLFSLNVTIFLDSIEYAKEKIEEWYEIVKEKTHKMRVSVIHNDLSLNHYLKGDGDYLIGWSKSRIDIPVFDLYKLYLKVYDDFDFIDILGTYHKKYPLNKEELLLFYILISMPFKIEFEDSNYKTIKKIQEEVNKLMRASKLIESFSLPKNPK